MPSILLMDHSPCGRFSGLMFPLYCFAETRACRLTVPMATPAPPNSRLLSCSAATENKAPFVCYTCIARYHAGNSTSAVDRRTPREAGPAHRAYQNLLCPRSDPRISKGLGNHVTDSA